MTWYKLFLQNPCTRFWLNKKFKDGSCSHVPLVFAIENDHQTVVEVLLDTLKETENYINIHKVMPCGGNAFMFALYHTNIDIVDTLLRTLDNEDTQKQINLSSPFVNGKQISALFQSKNNKTKVIIDILRLILSKNDKIVSLPKLCKFRIIDTACQYQNLSTVKSAMLLIDLKMSNKIAFAYKYRSRGAILNSKFGQEIVNYFNIWENIKVSIAFAFCILSYWFFAMFCLSFDSKDYIWAAFYLFHLCASPFYFYWSFKILNYDLDESIL